MINYGMRQSGEKKQVLMKWRRTARMSQQLFKSWDEAKKAYEEINDEERDMLELRDGAERTKIRLFEELAHAIENETLVDEWNGPILSYGLIERMSPYNKSGEKLTASINSIKRRKNVPKKGEKVQRKAEGEREAPDE